MTLKNRNMIPVVERFIKCASAPLFYAFLSRRTTEPKGRQRIEWGKAQQVLTDFPCCCPGPGHS